MLKSRKPIFYPIFFTTDRDKIYSILYYVSLAAITNSIKN